VTPLACSTGIEARQFVLTCACSMDNNIGVAA
jgi:hypothetical protein